MITVALASDHAGVELKKELENKITEMGFKTNNLGTNTADSVDYPDYGFLLAEEIAQKKADFGVIICGSGIGISIAANRNKHVRAALCMNKELSILARKHNNANVLALGARHINTETAKECLEAFLTTDFEGDRHEKRVKKLFKTF